MNVYSTLLGVTLGGLGGYAWYRLVGCQSGACPITARWYTSSLYGALIGFLMSRGF